MSGQQNSPRPEVLGLSSVKIPLDRTDSTAGWCVCPRSGDNWMCQDQPRLSADPEGRCCALGGTLRLTGRDRWDGLSARALDQTPCGGTDADA